jgi:hypothetical protein
VGIIDESRTIEDIRRLPVDVRLHLAHVVRNGMCVILSAHRLGGDVERAIFDLESKWKEFGL